MGASTSKDSYLQYTNDFELVIRATKDFEHLLETEFGAHAGSREHGLHDRITFVEQSVGLSPGTVRQMRQLVTRT